jgi:hypothetical protein
MVGKKCKGSECEGDSQVNETGFLRVEGEEKAMVEFIPRNEVRRESVNTDH